MQRSTRVLAWIWIVRSVVGWVLYSILIPFCQRDLVQLPIRHLEILWPGLYLMSGIAYKGLLCNQKQGWWIALAVALGSCLMVSLRQVLASYHLFYVVWFGNEWLLRATGHQVFGVFDDSLALYILTAAMLLADPPWRWRKSATEQVGGGDKD